MSRKEYVIPFIGLKTGNHVFEYDLTDAFFEGIEDSIIHRGNVHVKLELEKKETMLVGIYHRRCLCFGGALIPVDRDLDRFRLCSPTCGVGTFAFL